MDRNTIQLISHLVVKDGPNKGKTFSVSNGSVLTIGRKHTNDIILTDPTVSRAHCIIKLKLPVLILDDLSSTSGCFLEKRRVFTAVIRPRQRFSLGSSIVQFCMELPKADSSHQRFNRRADIDFTHRWTPA